MSPIKVNDSSKDEKILCPSDSCSQLIDYENLIDLIQEQNIRDRYQRLVTNSFVTHNQLLRWCPNGSCLHAVRVKYNGFQLVFNYFQVFYLTFIYFYFCSKVFLFNSLLVLLLVKSFLFNFLLLLFYRK
jgi:hypothetical protein